MRSRLRKKVISSRCHTTRAPRRSSRIRLGGRRSSSHAPGGRRGRDVAVVGVVAIALLLSGRRACGRARRGWCCRAPRCRGSCGPVHDMKTSSSDGRATLTERIGTPSSANSRGTKSSPSATWKSTSSLVHAGLEAEVRVAARRSSAAIVVGGDPHPVGADPGLQRLGGALHHDPAAVHDRDAVAVLGLVHVVRRQEDRDLARVRSSPTYSQIDGAGLRIEADGRLVEEQHARRVQQAAGDLEASLHAAREGADQARRALGEPGHLEHVVDARPDLASRHAVELGVEAQVLLRRQVHVERRVLEHEADAAAHLEALAHHVAAGHQGAARRRLEQGAEHLDRRGLARPRWDRGNRRSRRAPRRSRPRSRPRSRRTGARGRAPRWRRSGSGAPLASTAPFGGRYGHSHVTIPPRSGVVGGDQR